MSIKLLDCFAFDRNVSLILLARDLTVILPIFSINFSSLYPEKPQTSSRDIYSPSHSVCKLSKSRSFEYLLPH